MPLHIYKVEVSVAMTKELFEWRFVPLLASYCCNKFGSRNNLGVRYVFVVKRPSVTCIATGKDFISSRIAHDKSLRETYIAENSLLEVLTSAFAGCSDGKGTAWKA